MNSLVQRVLDQLIQEIETGNVQWRKSWVAGGGMPSNAITGNDYQGMNVLLLWVKAMKAGYASPQWATLKQWGGAGYRVKEAEIRNNTPIFFYKTYEKQENGETVTVPVARCAWVFNADQVEGWNPQPKISLAPEERHDNCKVWLDSSGIKLVAGDPAYSPTFDIVAMPDQQKFRSLDDYWTTMFHEAVHWTGHHSRMNRELKRYSEDEEAYAFEELVAEIGSAFMDAKFGIDGTPMQQGHGAYLRHWLARFSDKRRAILRAATAANKAVQFLTKEQAEELAEAA